MELSQVEILCCFPFFLVLTLISLHVGFVCICSAGDWTQGLAACQASTMLLSHTPNPIICYPIILTSLLIQSPLHHSPLPPPPHTLHQGSQAFLGIFLIFFKQGSTTCLYLHGMSNNEIGQYLWHTRKAALGEHIFSDSSVLYALLGCSAGPSPTPSKKLGSCSHMRVCRWAWATSPSLAPPPLSLLKHLTVLRRLQVSCLAITVKEKVPATLSIPRLCVLMPDGPLQKISVQASLRQRHRPA
jgi:hypothetical protein